VEIWVVRPFHCGRGPVKTTLKQRQIDYLKTIIQTIFLFALGIAICFLITEVGKRKTKKKIFILYRIQNFNRYNWSIKTILFNCL
jgi:hypothetical protein